MTSLWVGMVSRWKDSASGLREILESYVFSRVALILVGWIALGRIPWGYYSPTFNITTKTWLLMWLRWDALWYLKIAEHGYQKVDSLAFFPTYPLLIRGVHDVTRLPFDVAALLLSNAMCLGFLFVFWALMAEYFDESVRRRALWAALAFPTAFFMSAAYTESTFLFLSLMVFWLAKRQRFWWAGLFAIGATLTRNEGVFTVIPILWQYYLSRGFRFRVELLSIFSVPLAMAGFMYFQWRHFGNPLAFIDSQSAWGRHITWPWVGITLAIGRIWHGSSLQASTVLSMIDLSSSVVSALLWLYSRKRLPVDWMIYWGVLWLIDVSAPSPYGRSPLLSMSRLVLILFPMYVGLGILTENSTWQRLSNWVFPLLQALFFTIFATWHWIA
jgi:hypothetical protein